MARTATVVGVVLLVVVFGATAFVVGLGPFGGGDGEGDDFPTATPTDAPGEADGADGGGTSDDGDDGGSGSSDGASGSEGDSDDGGGDAGDGAANRPPYTFTVTDVANCGRTCRDVTVELTNNREQAAQDVVVNTRIFAGNSTDADARVWQGSEEVGRLEAGETTTATKRVDLSYSAAFAIQRQEGWITIETTVRSADVTRTFIERRDVV